MVLLIAKCRLQPKKSELFPSFGIIVRRMGNRMECQNDAGTMPALSEQPLSLPNLIASYGDRLLRSACLMCGHSGDAQDIVQETFCRALAALPDFRGEAGVYTWLFSIMRNVYLKQRRRERRVFHFLERQPQVSHSQHDPIERLEQQRTQTQLMMTLQKLPVKQREIVVLRFVNDMKISDIARVLTLSEGTVKSRLYKAGNRLQALMGNRCSRPLSACEGTHEV
jgi:RNA polymerase sigma-70 factor, ECF subfamily